MVVESLKLNRTTIYSWAINNWSSPELNEVCQRLWFSQNTSLNSWRSRTRKWFVCLRFLRWEFLLQQTLGRASCLDLADMPKLWSIYITKHMQSLASPSENELISSSLKWEIGGGRGDTRAFHSHYASWCWLKRKAKQKSMISDRKDK